MAAASFNAKAKRGLLKAAKLEAALARKYEQVIRKAAKRSAKAYLAALTPVMAAAERPPLDDIVLPEVLLEAAIAASAATRKRMAVVQTQEMLGPQLGSERRRVLEELVAAQGGRQAERLVEGVRESVAKVILDSLTEGWTVPETAAQIGEAVTGIAKWQSTMLARTDLIGISNASSVTAAQSLGEDAPAAKTWLAASDERTRETHAEANGQTVAIDDAFDVGGEALQYPGDPDGSDAETINCRCTIIYGDDVTAGQGILSEEPVTAAVMEEDTRVPWHIEHEVADCAGYAVIKDADGTVAGCHDTRESAVEQIQALYANEPDAAMSAAFTAEERRQMAESGEALPDGSYPIRNRSDLQNAIGSLGRASQNDEYDRVKRHIIKRARALDALDMLPEDWGITASTAAAPFAPPAEWFDNPGFRELTPLTVADDGRVFGHIADWNLCHTGIQGRCVTPPRGLSYDYFNVGALDTREGETVRVGKITVGTGHAPLNASRASATAHYDNTGYVAALVHAGEDEFGPWVAGAIKSDATQEQVRDMRVNGPSGDWREIKRPDGTRMLELIGVLAVPVQGFPIAAVRASVDEVEWVTAIIAGTAYTDAQDHLGMQHKFRELADELGALLATTYTIETDDPNFTFTVSAPEDEFVVPPEMFSPRIDREIAYRVAFFTDHGYWPANPLSGHDFTPEEWDVIQRVAANLVDEPETEESGLLRERLLDTGFLVT